MQYRLNVALLIRGDRAERGAFVELSDEEVAALDPADIIALSDLPIDEPEEEIVVPFEEMTGAQLKDHAAMLGLSATGSKADLQERIRLHLEANPDGAEPEEEITNAN